MAQATLLQPMPSSSVITCKAPTPKCERHYIHIAALKHLGPQSLHNLFSAKGEQGLGSRRSSQSQIVRASLGGDGDVDLNGDSIAEDFYSVLGLVRTLKLLCPWNLFWSQLRVLIKSGCNFTRSHDFSAGLGWERAFNWHRSVKWPRSLFNTFSMLTGLIFVHTKYWVTLSIEHVFVGQSVEWAGSSEHSFSGPLYPISKGREHEVVRALETHPEALLPWNLKLTFV